MSIKKAYDHLEKTIQKRKHLPRTASVKKAEQVMGDIQEQTNRKTAKTVCQ